MKIRLWKLGHSSLQVCKSGAKRGSDELTNFWNSHALCASFIFSIKYYYYILLSNLLNSHAICAKSVKIFSLLLFIQRCRRRKEYSETKDIFLSIHRLRTRKKGSETKKRFNNISCPQMRIRKNGVNMWNKKYPFFWYFSGGYTDGEKKNSFLQNFRGNCPGEKEEKWRKWIFPSDISLATAPVVMNRSPCRACEWTVGSFHKAPGS